ncbi:ABC transporter permease [Winogradskyella sp.]|uniref:ABC transporter permease n=1 Tax=Winogradskyella sp. TaxID=1883156 RepID=UPI002612BC75|nr:ABC transporter permease [Winogradskyella sp.]
MLKNYFKIAYRNLRKNKIFTSLNIIGLTAAFGVAILLAMYAAYELSYDRFHEHGDNLYMVYSEDSTPNGIEANITKSEPFAAALRDELTGVKKITRYRGSGDLLTYGDKQLQMSSAYVDPDFFDMFSFPIIEGDRENPITSESDIAITEFASKRIFGDENAVGKTVTLLLDEKEVPFKVSAIIEDFPETSSLGFDIILNFKSQGYHAYERTIGRWDIENHEIYMELADAMTPAQFEKSTKDFTELHYKQEIQDAKRDGVQPHNGVYRQIKLLSFSDIRFANFSQGPVNVNRTMPYLVLGIAILILFIASVNFINMSIAKSDRRLREIGMRKTLGANKRQLFFQFWGESILVFVTSIGLGVLLALFLLPHFQLLFRTKATFEIFLNPSLILLLISGIIVITLVAGGYPAVLMSRLKTLQSLKGKLDSNGKNYLRNGLMILQFGIAILLIGATLVLQNQIEFMRTKDLGFNKDQVIAFPLNGKRNDQQALRLLRDALKSKPNILSVSASNNILGLGKDGSRSTSVLGFDYKNRGIETHMLVVDADFTETLDLNLVKGRSFKKNLASDSLSVIINESMAKQLNEEEILSAKLNLDDSKQFSVVGVVKDFNFQDLDRNIAPLTLFALPNWNLRNVYVKVAPHNLEESYITVKEAWASVEPNAEFEGSFLDENIERTLRNERNMMTMIGSGSILAITLSCIGLFAMSLLIVAQRRKEIGVRKIVGASVMAITVLLTKDFLKLVSIAFLIATPISWWLMSKWLQNYAYSIDLNILLFILAGGIALLIAIVTIAGKTISAAIANPVKSLRSE